MPPSEPNPKALRGAAPNPTARPGGLDRNRAADLGLALLLVAAALGTNFFFRGAVDDNSRQSWDWADNYYGRSPLSPTNRFEDVPPLHPFVLHVSFALLGHTLIALHLPAFLAGLANPVLAYLLFRDVFRSRLAGTGGALLLLAWPTALFFYNQALAEPLTLTIVLLIFLAYERERLVPLLVLAPIALLDAYDSPMILGGLALDALLNRRRSKFHRRLAWLIAGGGVLLLLGLALDAFVFHWNVFPIVRLKANIVTRFELIEHDFSFAKIDQVNRFFFAYLLLPVVAVGAVSSFRRERRLWGVVPLAGYVAYELLLRPMESEAIPVTLRHLTIVVPCAVLLTLSAVRAAARQRRTAGPWSRRAVAAYGLATLAALVLVQAKYWYYRSSVEVSIDPLQLARTDHEIPRYVYLSNRGMLEPKILREAPALAGGEAWQDVVLDLEEALVEIDRAAGIPHSPAARVDVIGIRGAVEIEGIWLLDRPAGRTEQIPLEDWRAISPEGQLTFDRTLLLRTDDYRFAIAYPLDRPFVAGGRGDALRLRLRGHDGGQLVVNVAVWNKADIRSFLAFRPRLSPLIEELDGVDEQVVRTYHDQVYRNCLGFFRPEGLWMMAPLMAYDWAYYELGDRREENPPGRIERRTEGPLVTVGDLTGLTGSGEGSIEYHVRLDRPVGHLSLAGFFCHLGFGDRIDVRLDDGAGGWTTVGVVDGTLQRSYWGRETDEANGRQDFRLRLEFHAGWLPDAIRARFPTGVRDLAIGVRLENP